MSTATRTRRTVTCPHPKCAADIPRSMFACRIHWRSLPQDIRNEIWAGYKKYLAGGERTDHTLAALKAIRFWNEERVR